MVRGQGQAPPHRLQGVVDVERLGQHRVRLDLGGALGRVRRGGHHQDRRVPSRTPAVLASEGPPIHDGHVHVQQDQVGAVFLTLPVGRRE